MDFYCEWNGDWLLTAAGDIQAAVGWDEVRQRIVRKALTNSHQQLPDGSYTAADYVFHPDYGRGLASYVDQLFSLSGTDANSLTFKRGMSQAILSEPPPVDTGTPPTIIFGRPAPNTMTIGITVYLTNGLQGAITLSMGR